MKKNSHGDPIRARVIRVEFDPQALEDVVRLLTARERQAVLVHTVYVNQNREDRCSLCGERIRGSHACSWSASSGRSEAIAFGESRSHAVGESVSVTTLESDR